MTNIGSKEQGYAMLAAAIVKSGQDANDKYFLKSKWCEELKDLVMLYLEQNEGERYRYLQ